VYMPCERPLPWRSARVTVTGFRNDWSFDLAVVSSLWQTLRNNGSRARFPSSRDTLFKLFSSLVAAF